MLIPVCGMDPSLRNWGLSTAHLDLDTGILTDPILSLVQTSAEEKVKKVRQNSFDLECAEILVRDVFPVAELARVIFVEVPSGSQSALSMKGYGICVGILGALRARGIPIIEVSEQENKKCFVGKRNATKAEMIAEAMRLYPNSNWPMHHNRLSSAKAEHMADATAAIHAGVRTPVFQNLMRLFAKV